MRPWPTVTTKNKAWRLSAVHIEHAKKLQGCEDFKCNKLEHIGEMVPVPFAEFLGRQVKEKFGLGYVVDFCCGEGGFSKGFQKAGHKILLGIDKDPEVLRCYKRNIGEADTLCMDIRLLKGRKLALLKPYRDKRPLFVLASPPCKDFSVANRKRRYDLPVIRHCFWLISYLQPEVYIFENVPSTKKILHCGEIVDVGIFTGQRRLRWIYSNFDFRFNMVERTLDYFLHKGA